MRRYAFGRKFFDWQNYEIPALNTLVCLDCGKDVPYDWDRDAGDTRREEDGLLTTIQAKSTLAKGTCLDA